MLVLARCTIPDARGYGLAEGGQAVLPFLGFLLVKVRPIVPSRIEILGVKALAIATCRLQN